MNWELLLNVTATVATVISTVIAVRSKNEAKKILKQIREEKSHNIKNSGEVHVSNSGNNSGIISGINSGEIHK